MESEIKQILRIITPAGLFQIEHNEEELLAETLRAYKVNDSTDKLEFYNLMDKPDYFWKVYGEMLRIFKTL